MSQALSAGLPRSHLTELDVSGNCDLGDTGAVPILAAAKGHASLARLNLGSASLTAKSSAAIQALLLLQQGGGGATSGSGSKPQQAAGRAAASAGKAPTQQAAGALTDLVVTGNDDLPDAVVELVAGWKTLQWVRQQHGL
jgi:hypothetical protein